ncbi:MAG: hypothetical protein WCV58_00565 [Patescibacteria group bacterium]
MEEGIKSKKSKKIIIGIVFFIVFFALLICLRGSEDTWIKDENGNWVKHGNPSGSAPVTNFEECAKLYPVIETYPEQCKTPDGKSFTKKY